MSKLRFLPPTDIAEFAPLPLKQKYQQLNAFKLIHVPYSYRPVRESMADLLSLDTPLLGALDRVSFEQVAAVIRQKSKSQAEEDANLRVAAGLYNLGWKGRSQNFGSIPTTIGHRLSYWTSAVVAVDGRAVVPFFNPRQKPLSVQGRRFVFSMMHEKIRVADPDYADVGLCICHFAKSKDGEPRNVKPIFDTGVDLYSFDELQAMVAETYMVWADVWTDRVAEARRRGEGRG